MSGPRRFHMGQTMAECDCPRPADCTAAERCLAAEPARRTAPGITVLHNPFQTVLEAAAALWPDLRCRVIFVPRGDLKAPAHGHTCFPADGGPPDVLVGTHLPLEGAVEVLAHELAHAAAGTVEPDPHGPRWKAAFALIHAEYCRRVDADFAAANAEPEPGA